MHTGVTKFYKVFVGAHDMDPPQVHCRTHTHRKTDACIYHKLFTILLHPCLFTCMHSCKSSLSLKLYAPTTRKAYRWLDGIQTSRLCILSVIIRYCLTLRMFDRRGLPMCDRRGLPMNWHINHILSLEECCFTEDSPASIDVWFGLFHS